MTIGTVQINPQQLESSYWRWGRALDVHTVRSIPIGTDGSGRTEFDTTRSAIGEMLYQLKYRNAQNQVDSIADIAAEYVRRTFLRRRPIHRIVRIPPSQPRARQPVYLLAAAIGSRLAIPVVENAVYRRSRTSPAKNTDDADQRRRDQHNAFAVNPSSGVSGAVVLLFDDLYQTGSTSESVARLLKEQGDAAEVCFLAITRTRRRL